MAKSLFKVCMALKTWILNVFPILHYFSVWGRQTVTRRPGDDGGEIKCTYEVFFLYLLFVKLLHYIHSLHYYYYMQEKNTELYHPALEELRRQIRSSTTSMTSVPKPLKFLRPHYGKLKEIYDGMAAGENKVRLCCALLKILQFREYFCNH